MKDIEYEYYEQSNNGFCYQFTMRDDVFLDLQRELEDSGIDSRFMDIDWMKHPTNWRDYQICVSFKYKSDAIKFKLKWC